MRLRGYSSALHQPRLLVFAACLAACALSQRAFAEGQREAPSGSEASGFDADTLLDEVVFRGEEHRQDVRSDLLFIDGERPSQRLRVDRDSTQSARDLSDLIQRTTEYAPADGDTTAPSIEGLSGAYFNVLIDGLPATTRIQTRNGPTVDLSLIPINPEDIERIDVYQGIGPAASGDGSGVVLDIITKQDVEPGITAEFGATAGDEGLHGFDARSTLRLRPTDDLLVRTGLHFIQDYALDADNNGTNDSPRARTFGLNTSMLWRRSDDERTQIAADYSSRSNERENPSGPNNLLDRQQLRIRARNVSELDSGWVYETTAAVGSLNDEFAKQDASDPDGDRLISSSRIIDGLGAVHFKNAFGPVDLGLELCGSGLQVGQVDADARRTTHGEGQACASVNLHWWASEKVDIVGRALGAYHSEFGPRTVAGTTLSYRPTSHWSLRLSIDWNERVPTAEERFQFFDHSEIGYIVQGNPDVSTERTLSLRAGVGAATKDEALGVNIGAFSHFQQARIDPVLTETAATSGYGAALYEYQNVGDARTAGIRGEARASAAAAGLTFVARYTWLPLVQNISTDEQLEFQSRHAVRVQVDGSWLDDRVSAWTSLGARSPMTWSSGAEGAPPNEWQPIWNVGIAGQILDQLELRVEAQNLLNETDPQFGPFGGWEVRSALRFNLAFARSDDEDDADPPPLSDADLASTETSDQTIANELDEADIDSSTTE